MNFTLENKDVDKELDFVFQNPTITNFVDAMELLQKGKNVAVFFDKPLDRTDNFQITQTLPTSLVDIPNAVKKVKLWNQIFQLCPHLVQTQKVIYTNSDKKLFTTAVDATFRHQFNKKIQFIDQTTPSNLSFLKIEKLKGIVFQEYKFNVSRFFIELLKSFEIQGGKIIFEKLLQTNNNTKIVTGTRNNLTHFLIKTTVPDNFSLHTKINDSKLLLWEQRKQLRVEIINSDRKIVNKQSAINNIQQFVSFTKNDLKEEEQLLFLTQKIIKSILNISKLSLTCSFEHSTMNDNYELSLEKFDIAKQTRIEYLDFKILFHRYGSAIDEMIDIAYELMNETRDPKEIWIKAEDLYQKKYEWKL